MPTLEVLIDGINELILSKTKEEETEFIKHDVVVWKTHSEDAPTDTKLELYVKMI
jgi:hypothetical protein